MNAAHPLTARGVSSTQFVLEEAEQTLSGKNLLSPTWQETEARNKREELS